VTAAANEGRPEGFRRVAQALAERGHAHAPVWLEVSARTSQEAADALGIEVGQIAKSVIFRRKSDDSAVLVVTSGDRRVDEKKVAAQVGALARADADFVKARTGFTIGGVAPLAHDAAGHADRPRAVPLRGDLGRGRASERRVPAQPGTARGADRRAGVRRDAEPRAMTSTPVASPCIDVCRIDASTGLCEGCLRTLDEIAAWSALDDDAKRAVWALLDERREALPIRVESKPR
jgi:predicted Fe-S protein YdhL (DUF1289 family)